MPAWTAFFNPRSVAVVGASADPSKLTGRPITYLHRHRFSGAIYPVNPGCDTIGDLKCYANAAALPEPPELALILLRAERVNAAVRDFAEAGTKAAIVLASGFDEAGELGRKRQLELREAAGDMRVLGPNTIGLMNVTDGIMLSASGAMDLDEFPAGSIGVISQSGGILGSLLSRGVARGLGFSKLVATGNECDIDVADVIEAFVEDDATRVIAIYLETIRNPQRFRAAAHRALEAGKRIIAYKVGRSDSGARSTLSHTGALAGNDAVYDALFEQLSIVRAASFSELLDYPAALACGRSTAGKRIAIVTSTGGAAGIIADNVGLAGLEVPTPPPDVADALLALDLPDAALTTNPIDVTLAGLRPDLYRRILATLADSPAYDAIAVVIGSSAIRRPDLVTAPLLETLSLTAKPIVAYVSPDAPALVKHLNQSSVPAFASPESCALALKAMSAKPRAQADGEGVSAPSIGTSDFVVGTLNEFDSKALFKRFGINAPRGCVCEAPNHVGREAAAFGRPMVLKILSGAVQHKSDIGGVAVGITPETAEATARRMLERARAETAVKIEGFLLQEMIEDAVELIIGFQRDPNLGPYILLGAGGTMTELYADVAIRLLPISRRDAEDMIARLRCAPLLDGFRGRPAADTNALIDAIIAFAEMATALGEHLEEAEINPLFVLERGLGVKAGDGHVVLR